MIEQLISTSAPRCLDGNAGFGIVAQTAGMAPNVSQAAVALSGYTHVAPPGSGKNPVVYLHAIRRTGGMTRHFVSRIADSGNDYSGRSNRIAHHWIIAEDDVHALPGGPAELLAQNLFRSNWNEKPAELPPKGLSVADVKPKKCTVWERFGDAGWGGIVAERAERGDPISIIFSPEHNSETLRALIGESLALLPPPLRWRTTFCTYYMKSHEASDDKIQIKCFLAGSEESQFSRQSPNTLVIDLRQRQGTAPAGKYVETARGMVKQPQAVPLDAKIPAAAPVAVSVPMANEPEMQETYELAPSPLSVPRKGNKPLDYTSGRDSWTEDDSSGKTDRKTVRWPAIALVIILLILGGVRVLAWLIPSIVKEGREPQSQGAVVQSKQEERKATVEQEKQGEPEQAGHSVETDGATETNPNADSSVAESVDSGGTTDSGTGKEASPLVADTELEGSPPSTPEDNNLSEIADKLEDLPHIWKELALDNWLDLDLRQRHPVTLEKSEFLYKHKDTVNFNYKQFLRDSVKFEINGHTIIFRSPDKKNTDIEDGAVTKQEWVKIAEINLTSEGLQFNWEQPAGSSILHDKAEINEYLIQILLSKLYVTVGYNEPHDICLWTPIGIPVPSDIQTKDWKFFDASKLVLEYNQQKWAGFDSLFSLLGNQDLCGRIQDAPNQLDAYQSLFGYFATCYPDLEQAQKQCNISVDEYNKSSPHLKNKLMIYQNDLNKIPSGYSNNPNGGRTRNEIDADIQKIQGSLITLKTNMDDNQKVCNNLRNEFNKKVEETKQLTEKLLSLSKDLHSLGNEPDGLFSSFNALSLPTDLQKTKERLDKLPRLLPQNLEQLRVPLSEINTPELTQKLQDAKNQLSELKLKHTPNQLARAKEAATIYAERIGKRESTNSDEILKQVEIYLSHPTENDKLLLMKGGK
jgi:hypothetical protein